MGRVVLNAWVLGALPESETCAGWDAAQIQNLHEKVYADWEPYARPPGRLPDELRQRHQKIYSEAVDNAKNKG